MNIDNRICYDVREFIANLDQALDNLRIFQYESHYTEILGENLIKKISIWDKSIRMRKDDPFTIVVCGEFKRGKSTLINALLNEEVATMNVTTETVTLNIISYGSHSNEIVLSGGRRMTISDDELQKQKLENLIRNFQEKVTTLEIHRPIELLKSIKIIDTPGLNDSLLDFSSIVEQAIHQADAIIYVFSIDSPLSLSEQLFIRTMILPQKYTDIFIVANFADIIINKNDFVRMQEYMNQKILSMLPGQSVILLSALDEICRFNSSERPNHGLQEELSNEFDNFREKINELLLLKKDTILPYRLQRLKIEMLQELNDGIDVIEAGLELDEELALKHSEAAKKEQFERNIRNKEFQENVKNEIIAMNFEAEDWIDELFDLMQAEVNTFIDMKTEDIKKYYSIFCIKTIQEAINKCVDYHVEKLYSEFDSNIIKPFTRSEVNYGFKFSFYNRIWTNGDNIGYVASKFLQFNLFNLIIDGVVGAMREKEAVERLPESLTAIIKQFPAFRESAREVLRKVYEDLNQEIQKQLTEYFSLKDQEAAHRSEQILQAASQSKDRKRQTRAAIIELRKALKNFDVKEVLL